MNRTLTRSLAVVAIAALVAAACGGDDDDDSEGADSGPTATDGTTAGGDTTAGGGAVDLSACPNPIVIQTDWFPEAEHGALYEMVGEGYTVDTDKQVVRGPLVAGGEETGIDIEVRTGGPAIGDQPVSVQQYADDSITLGYANTEGQIVRYGETPVLSVVAPLEINPQIIYWDPETYPDIETLADLGEEGVTINVFSAGTFADVFVAEGIWNEDQIDPSYDGSPARFIAEDGAIAQQGFASAEPYTYENVFEEWGKPVAFQTLHDAGFEVYSQTLSIVPDQLERAAAVPGGVRADRPAGGDRLHRRPRPGQRHHRRRRRAVRQLLDLRRGPRRVLGEHPARARASSATAPTTRSATWTRRACRACSTRSATPASTCPPTSPSRTSSPTSSSIRASGCR